MKGVLYYRSIIMFMLSIRNITIRLISHHRSISGRGVVEAIMNACKFENFLHLDTKRQMHKNEKKNFFTFYLKENFQMIKRFRSKKISK